MPLVLFWDIDGTLLTTKRAGITAWERAVTRVLGIQARLHDFATAGLTDPAIANQIVEQFTGRRSPSTAARLTVAYEDALPECLPLRDGHAMPEAKAILEAFSSRRDVHSILLTGNTRRGAMAKLVHVGLQHHFEGGAFADGLTDRSAVARAALEIAQRRVETPHPPGRRFVVGDTPHDVACARAIEARCVAVATGVHAAEDLRRAGAWRVYDRLPPPNEFLDHLGMD